MYEHIVGAFLADPWLLLPEKGRAIAGLLALRARGERVDAETIRSIMQLRDAKHPEGDGVRLVACEPASVTDAARTCWPANAGLNYMWSGTFSDFGTAGNVTLNGLNAAVQSGASPQRSVAVLPLYGVMMPRVGDIEESSGMVSTERWGRAFSALVNDPSVAAIVLDVDSPGGAVPGTAELAQRVYDARGTKPIVAVANYMIASAAYWVASQADEIVMSPSAEVGSIGIWTAHLDESAAFEMQGIKAELISAGKYKVEGNNLGPLTDEARAHIQARVDAEYDAFTAAVARGRGVAKATARGPQFGEGRTYLAQEAVQRGMADRIGTLEETIARAASGKVKMRSAAMAAEVEPAPETVPDSHPANDIDIARRRIALLR